MLAQQYLLDPQPTDRVHVGLPVADAEVHAPQCPPQAREIRVPDRVHRDRVTIPSRFSRSTNRVKSAGEKKPKLYWMETARTRLARISRTSSSSSPGARVSS